MGNEPEEPNRATAGLQRAGQRASEASSARLETTTNLTNVFFSKHRPDPGGPNPGIF